MRRCRLGRYTQALWQDIHYAVRGLRRSPGFTLLAVTVLSLGIGANSAIFSVVEAVLLRPFPYRDSGRLVMVSDQLTKLGLNQFPVTFANYFDYRNQNAVFEDMAAFNYADFSLTEAADPPERIPGMRVSANLFPLVGVEPALGRAFAPEENRPGRGNVVLLSDELWRRRFGADPKIIGKTITLDQSLFVVTGVMPRGFRFTARSAGFPELWTPLALQTEFDRTAGALQVLARLKRGVAVDQAQANLKTVAAAIERQYHPYRGPRGEDAGYGVTVVPLREQIFGNLRQGLLVLMGAVGFVLLIACANVANMLLAKAAAREREMAIRKALGAGRARIVAQLLTESALFALLGACGGLFLAWWSVEGLVALAPGSVAISGRIGISAPVFAFTLALSVLTGLLFGLAPALQASQAALNESLRGVQRRRLPFSALDLLVVAEVALSLVLVVGAALLARSFLRLEQVNPCFNAEKLITAQISLSAAQYRQNYQSAAFYGQLVERLATVAEVKSASVVSRLPLSGAGAGARGGDPFSIEGSPYNGASLTPQVVNFQVAGTNYFRTMQIPLLEGRDFTPQDSDATTPVTIINETMARGFWQGKSPLGQRIMLGAPQPGKPWLTVVGVVGDVRNAGLEVTPIPQMYVPHQQNPSRAMTLLIRTDRSPQNVVSELRREVLALDRNQPVYDVNTMEQRLAGSVAQPRFQTLLVGLFAAVALVLAAVGIYGVVACSVARRAREIGIRMALGAEPGAVLSMVVRQGMTPALIGMALGIGGALAMNRVLASLLFEVRPTDPAAFAATVVLLAAVALVACLLPARRAARVDPVQVLRQE